MQTHQTTVDPSEIAKFEAMAAEWWDPNGKFKPLHMLNPCRLDYITNQIAAEFDRDLKGPAAFAGLRIYHAPNKPKAAAAEETLTSDTNSIPAVSR